MDHQKHLFYLHGRIIEVQGRAAISPRYGKYEYDKIIATLENTGAVTHATVRTEAVNFNQFVKQTSAEIDSIIKSGVNPKHVTIIGASKGAVMAMNIAAINEHPINYVLLGANSPNLETRYNWNLHGHILGIYERSDSIAGRNYQYWIKTSTNATHFKELEINTGLGHGFLYQPINEWVKPTLNWINNQYN